MKLGVAEATDTIGVEDVRQISVWDGVNVGDNDGLEGSESFVLATHFVLLGATEGSQDVGDMVSVERTFFGKLVRASFNSPKDILKVTHSHHIEGLSQSSELLSVGLLASFGQIVLIIGDELFDCVPSVPSVDTILPRAA